MTDSGHSTSGIFERFAPQVYAWAYRLLGRHHDALDVVQDVFIKWTTQCRKDEPQRPAGWLRRVTLNRAVDVARKRHEPVDLELVGPRLASSDASPDDGDLDTLRSDVSAALRLLPEMQRSVLVAKVYDELTFAEVAEELDISMSTAKTHYVRALGSLRDRLRNRWLEEHQS